MTHPMILGGLYSVVRFLLDLLVLSRKAHRQPGDPADYKRAGAIQYLAASDVRQGHPLRAELIRWVDPPDLDGIAEAALCFRSSAPAAASAIRAARLRILASSNFGARQRRHSSRRLSGPAGGDGIKSHSHKCVRSRSLELAAFSPV